MGGPQLNKAVTYNMLYFLFTFSIRDNSLLLFNGKSTFVGYIKEKEGRKRERKMEKRRNQNKN